MHTEFISVKRSLLAELVKAERPVIAVGTTSVRTLESLYYIGQILEDNPDADESQLLVTQWMPYTTPCAISTAKALQNIIDYLDRHHADSYLGSTTAAAGERICGQRQLAHHLRLRPGPRVPIPQLRRCLLAAALSSVNNRTQKTHPVAA